MSEIRHFCDHEDGIEVITRPSDEVFVTTIHGGPADGFELTALDGRKQHIQVCKFAGIKPHSALEWVRRLANPQNPAYIT